MARARDKFTVVRTSHVCPEGLSESVVRRRAGWFLQSDEALQYELGNGYYDAGIVPLFLHRVLSIALTSAEWLAILHKTISTIAPAMSLDGEDDSLNAGVDFW